MSNLNYLIIAIDSSPESCEFVEKNIWGEIDLLGEGRPIRGFIKTIKTVSEQERNENNTLTNFINLKKEEVCQKKSMSYLLTR